MVRVCAIFPRSCHYFAATHPLPRSRCFLSSVTLARRFEAAEIDMILTVSAGPIRRRARSFIPEPLVWVGTATGWRFQKSGCRWRCRRMDARGGRRRLRWTGAGDAIGSPIRPRPRPRRLSGSDGRSGHRALPPQPDGRRASPADRQGGWRIGSYQLSLQKHPISARRGGSLPSMRAKFG